MPPKSKAQARYMRAVAAGTARAPKGLSRKQAREFVAGHPTRALPEKQKKQKKR